jgi:nucleoside-diphosphate-sugar epimerase
MTKPFKRILFTGAAGGLGRRLREHLHAFADIVRLSDLNDFGPAGEMARKSSWATSASATTSSACAKASTPSSTSAASRPRKNGRPS